MKAIKFIVFPILVIAQLYLPYSMIESRENLLLDENKIIVKCDYKIDNQSGLKIGSILLKVVLSAEIENQITSSAFVDNQKVFASFEKDSSGYYRVNKIYKDEPFELDKYSPCRIIKADRDWDNRANLRFPFMKFYISQDFSEQLQGQTGVTPWNVDATVYIKKGECLMTNASANNIEIVNLKNLELDLNQK